jgi:reactive intermediate/imine deaminase
LEKEVTEPETIHADAAPQPTGPFVQARRAGNILYIAGQRGIDPATGELVEAGIEARARRTLENLKAIAEAAGGSMASFLSTTVYVTDMKAYRPAVNKMYEEYFGENLPTRTIVEVRALNQDDIVEIDAVVLLPDTTS